MPSLSVQLDGTFLARVNTDGYDVLSVHVHGTRIDDDSAELEMSGGSYPDGGESTHLIWINSMPLRPGQEVEVVFGEDGETSHAGKTIAELFPNENSEPEQPEDFRPTAEMFAELRAKRVLRDGYLLTLSASTGTVFVGRTENTAHGFGFTIVWNSHRPGRANLSLHSYTLENLEQKTPMLDHVREYIEPVQAVRLRVDA